MGQRKPKKGTPGYLRQKNAMKRQSLKQAIQYIDQLEKDNEAMRFDPSTVIGQFFTQYRELYSQNSRLSVLCACLLKKSGDKVVLTKEEMESFKDQRINIKWELPEGVEKAEDAASFVFTYEVQPIQQPGQPATVVPTETPGTEAATHPSHADTAVEEALENEEKAATETFEDEVRNAKKDDVIFLDNTDDPDGPPTMLIVGDTVEPEAEENDERYKGLEDSDRS